MKSNQKVLDVIYLAVLLFNCYVYIYDWGIGIKIHPIFGLAPSLLLITTHLILIKERKSIQ